MLLRPTSSKRPDTLLPYTTRFRFPLRPSGSASETGTQGRPVRGLPWTLWSGPRVTVLVILIGCVLILGFWLNSYSARSWTPDRSAGGGCSRGGAARPEPRERR